MNESAQRAKYRNSRTAMKKKNNSCPGPSLAIDEAVNKPRFSTSKANYPRSAIPHTHSSPETELPLSIPLTDEKNNLLHSVCENNNADIFTEQESTYSPKDSNIKAICSILSLGITTPSEENFSETGANILRMESGVRLSEDQESIKRVNVQIEDPTKSIPDVSKGPLGHAVQLKLHSMNAVEESGALEDSIANQIHEVTVLADTSISFPEASSCSFNTPTTVPPRHISFMNEESIDSVNSRNSVKKPKPAPRSMPSTHEHFENPKKSTPSTSTAPFRVAERQKPVNSANAMPSTGSGGKAGTGLARQSSSAGVGKKDESTSFLNIIRKRVNVTLVAPSPRVVGPRVKRPAAGSDKDPPSPSAVVAPRARLISTKRWQLICSAWYKSRRRKLGRCHEFIKVKKAPSRRRHREKNPPEEGPRDRHMSGMGESKSPKIQADKLENGSFTMRKDEIKLENDGPKSSSATSSLPRSPLPFSPTRVGIKGGEGPAVAMSLQERLILRRQQQQPVKGLDPSVVIQPPSGRGKADTARRSGLNGPSIKLGTPLASTERDSPPLPASSTFSSRLRCSLHNPVVSSRASTSQRRSGVVACTTPSRRSPSTSLEKIPPLEGSVQRETSPAVSKIVIIPPLLSPEERERTATVVFDLDETLCNNRVAGPPLLRPGAVQLLHDLRAMYRRPHYKPLPFAAPSSAAGAGLKFTRSVSTLATCEAPTTRPEREENGLRLELVLWTASISCVAKRVLDRLDPQGAIFDQIIYQDSRWYSSDEDYTKDLRLLGRSMSNVVIVENAPASVKYNRRNAILVTDFSHNQNDRQLLVVRSVLTEWLNLLNRYLLRRHGLNDSLVLENQDDSSSKLTEKEPRSSGVVDIGRKSILSSQAAKMSMGDSNMFASTNRSSQHQMSSRNKLEEVSSPLSPKLPIQEKGKISVAQFLSLHDYIQKGTNYVRLSVVSRVASLYGEAVGAKPQEKAISARRPFNSCTNSGSTTSHIFHNSIKAQLPSQLVSGAGCNTVRPRL
ncbi:unnamed protein product [Phytomonas sp. EM1]|nr:unnamed protein product [Phytomonas sp. EM1]|eukprot:CCW63091.1 unnamed protein product [Phytomonas sp. isolate EM1]